MIKTHRRAPFLITQRPAAASDPIAGFPRPAMRQSATMHPIVGRAFPVILTFCQVRGALKARGMGLFAWHAICDTSELLPFAELVQKGMFGPGASWLVATNNKRFGRPAATFGTPPLSVR